MANVLTNLGEEWVVDKLMGSGGYTHAGAYVGWGTGAGTAAKADTSLFTESTDPGSAARVSGTITKAGSGGSTSKWQNVATLSATSTQTITNAGVFSTTGTATMFIKGDFTGIALVSGDSIQFTFTLDPA